MFRTKQFKLKQNYNNSKHFDLFWFELNTDSPLFQKSNQNPFKFTVLDFNNCMYSKTHIAHKDTYKLEVKARFQNVLDRSFVLCSKDSGSLPL